MKKLFTPLFLALLINQSSCMKLANRVAYGKTGKPIETGTAVKPATYSQTSSQAISQTVGQMNQSVGEVIQAKRSIDQYREEVTGEKKREKEERYAQNQRQDILQDQYIELKGKYLDLQHKLERIEGNNDKLFSENSQLDKRTSNLETENERLKSENESFRRSLSDVVERQNRFEITVVDAVSGMFNEVCHFLRPVSTASLDRRIKWPIVEPSVTSWPKALSKFQ